MTLVLPALRGTPVRPNTPIFYALSTDQMDTPADIRGYAALVLFGAQIIDPTEIHHRVCSFAFGADYLLDVIRDHAEALAYIPGTDGHVDDEVAAQIELAHDLGMSVYAIIGRELVEMPTPARLAA